MIKDTLEMIPVAIIMAILLFFGVSSGSKRLPSVASVSPACPTLTIPTPRPAPIEILPTVKEIDAPKEQESHTDFLNRRTFRSDVPYFTNADIPTARRPVLTEQESTPKTRQLSINKADLKSLTKIPGIGPTKAAQIIKARPTQGYKNWEEIDALPGFGSGTISMMQLHAEL